MTRMRELLDMEAEIGGLRRATIRQRKADGRYTKAVDHRMTAWNNALEDLQIWLWAQDGRPMFVRFDEGRWF